MWSTFRLLIAIHASVSDAMEAPIDACDESGQLCNHGEAFNQKTVSLKACRHWNGKESDSEAKSNMRVSLTIAYKRIRPASVVWLTCAFVSYDVVLIDS